MKIIQILSDKASRPVTSADIQTVQAAIIPMANLCKEKLGKYTGHALAHCQVERTDPLRFYVTKDGVCIINPEIINHTRHTVTNGEACMSYAHQLVKDVERWNKCEVRYQILETIVMKADPSGLGMVKLEQPEIKLSVPKINNLSGLEARIAQHEIDHFNGINIYQ